MALKLDFQQALETFIYQNLPILMNPMNAMNIVVSTTITPINPTSPMTPTTPTSPISPVVSATPLLAMNPTLDSISASSIVITPEVLRALRAYVVNNFPDLGLPKDIQEVTKNFFVNLPTVIPVVTPMTTTATTTAVTTMNSTPL